MPLFSVSTLLLVLPSPYRSGSRTLPLAPGSRFWCNNFAPLIAPLKAPLKTSLTKLLLKYSKELLKEHSKEQIFAPESGPCSTCTGLMGWIAHRKWKETKQHPGTAGPGNMLGCCLIFSHFLWAIHPIRPVYLFHFCKGLKGRVNEVSSVNMDLSLAFTISAVPLKVTMRL